MTTGCSKSETMAPGSRRALERRRARSRTWEKGRISRRLRRARTPASRAFSPLSLVVVRRKELAVKLNSSKILLGIVLSFAVVRLCVAEGSPCSLGDEPPFRGTVKSVKPAEQGARRRYISPIRRDLLLADK